jgi:hypothetical protein
MANDPTVRVFNNFYNFDLRVGADQYEVVYSYFRSMCSTDGVAKTFAETLFRVSNITQTDVMELLENIQGKTLMEVQLVLAYYLNTLSDTKTVLYGINTPLTPNEKVQRNIVY